MQEDIAGQNAAGVRRSYSTCSQCGRTFLRRAAVAQPGDVLQNAHSEFAELCHDCERLTRKGEAPVGGDEE